MKKNYFIIIGIALIILLGVAVLLFTGPVKIITREVLVPHPIIEEGKPLVIELAAQNKSGESGTASLSNVNGKTKVTLALAGAPEGVAQPAHIHAGSCDELGEVKYPLVPPVEGSSETMLTASPDELFSELPLAVNVHKSEEEIGVFVACGDIVAPEPEADEGETTVSDDSDKTPTE